MQAVYNDDESASADGTSESAHTHQQALECQQA